MGMGLLRWLLWPRRPKYEEDEPPRRRSRSQPRRRPQSHRPGVYRIEVDGEAGRFHGDGAPFSFWSSSRIILILSFLLWWIPPAGPMIAGYVGGRRAGSPIKAVIAALMPVFAIYIANVTYAHNFASHPADFVAQLPMAVGDAAASILPFLIPYKQFMISYLQGFVQGLATTFGMGTNGYLMVVIFAYIGGLIGEQTRLRRRIRRDPDPSDLPRPRRGTSRAPRASAALACPGRPGGRGRSAARATGPPVPGPQPGRGARDPEVRRARPSELRPRQALDSQEPFYRTPLLSCCLPHVLSEV